MTLTIDYIKKNWVPNKTRFWHRNFHCQCMYIYHSNECVIARIGCELHELDCNDFPKMEEIKQKKKIKLFRYTFEINGNHIFQTEWRNVPNSDLEFGKLLKIEEKEIEVNE